MEEIKINSQFVDPYKLGMTEAEAQQVLPYMVEYTFELVKCFYENLEVRAEFFEEFQNEGAHVSMGLREKLLGIYMEGITFGEVGARFAATEILEEYFTDKYDDLYGEQAKKTAERWVLSWLLVEKRGPDGVNPFVDPCHKGMSEEEFESYLPTLFDYTLLMAKRLWDDTITRGILEHPNNNYASTKQEFYRAAGAVSILETIGVSACIIVSLYTVRCLVAGKIPDLDCDESKVLAMQELKSHGRIRRTIERAVIDNEQ